MLRRGLLHPPLNGSQHSSCLTHLVGRDLVRPTVQRDLLDLHAVGLVVKLESIVGILLKVDAAVLIWIGFPG